MTIIPDAMDDSAVEPRPIPRPLRIPEAVPALEEVRPSVTQPTSPEIIRRAIESLP